MVSTPDAPHPDLAVRPHDCWRQSQVIECNDDWDTRRCAVCGREWRAECNFDDEYS